MNEKKTTTLSGILLGTLTLGKSACILHNGGTIRTSTVVDITDVSAGRISFETLNTRYTLLAPAMEQTALQTAYASVAA